MYSKSQTNIELEKLVRENEVELRKTFLANYKTQQATLDLFKNSIEHCDINNFNNNRAIWNLGSYVNIVSYDLKLIGENLFFNKDEWGKRYFARQSALVIYEAIDDILELAGKNFRKIIETFSNSQEFKEELNELTKEINKYKKENSEYLKLIRHNCAAHRDKDSIEQLKIIAAKNWSDSIGVLTKFDNLLMRFGKFMQKVINIGLDESTELRKGK